MPFRAPTIRVPQLKKLLALEKLNPTGIRLMDAAYTPRESAIHGDGRWKDSVKYNNHRDFIAQRLPGSIYFDLDIASYQRKYQLTSDIAHEAFEEYAQHLGVKKGDSVVVYGRGDFGGMLFAARVWYMFKVYGMKEVAVLEGGLAKWKEEGGEMMCGEEQGPANRPRRTFFGYPYTSIEFMHRGGNWTAADAREDLIVKFNDLLFERLEEVNMLDCRSAEEFDGRTSLTFLVNGTPGARLPGSKNVPLSTVIAPSGELKSAEEILQVLSKAGFDPAKPTYTVSNDGTKASLLGLALEKAGIKWSLFDGGLREVSKRDPSLISASGIDTYVMANMPDHD